MVSRLIRNQLPSNGLRVRAPCPPLSEPFGSRPDATGQECVNSFAAFFRSPPAKSGTPVAASAVVRLSGSGSQDRLKIQRVNSSIDGALPVDK